MTTSRSRWLGSTGETAFIWTGLDDWIGKTWTGLIKHGLIKHGLKKHRLIKHGFMTK